MVALVPIPSIAEETISVSELKSAGEGFVDRDVSVEGFFSSVTVPMLVSDMELLLKNMPLRESDYVVLQGDVPPSEWHGAKISVPVSAIVTSHVPVPEGTKGPGPIGQMLGIQVKSFKLLEESKVSAPVRLEGADFERIKSGLKGQRNEPALGNSYALLYSGGLDESNNYPRYFHDLAFMHEVLTGFGYSPENIVFAYADGTQPEHFPEPQYVDYTGDADGLTAAFQDLAGRMNSESRLFIFTTNHGGGISLTSPEDSDYGKWGSRYDSNGDEGIEPFYERNYGVDIDEDGDTSDRCSFDEVLWLWGGAAYDDDFAYLVNSLPDCQNITILMEQCFSGGLIRDLRGSNRIIMSAASQVEPSYSMDTGLFNEFSYYFTCAIARYDHEGNYVGADANADGRISVLEAFNYAVEKDTRPETPYYEDSNDGIGHPGPLPAGGDGDLGAYTYLD